MLGDIEDEDRKRNVMGLSATGKCIVLCEMLENFGKTLADGTTFEATAKELLKTNFKQPLVGWNAETLARYAAVGKKLNNLPLTLAALELMEFRLGRASLFDGITALRSLVGWGLVEIVAHMCLLDDVERYAICHSCSSCFPSRRACF